MVVAFRLAVPRGGHAPAEAYMAIASPAATAMSNVEAASQTPPVETVQISLPAYRDVVEAAPLASSRLASAASDGLRIAAERLKQEPIPAAAPAGEASLAQPATPACDPTQSTLYCVYPVEDGDTLSKIATKFGLKSSGDIANWDLLVYSNRPDIASAEDLIQLGQKIRIPSDTGAIHLVVSADTAVAVARSFGVTAADLLGATGPLSADQSLRAGTEVLVKNPLKLPSSAGGAAPAAATGPATAPTAAAALAASPATPTLTSPTAPNPVVSQGAPVAPSPAAAPALAAASPTRAATPASNTTARKTGFIWPATGPISSAFGPSHPLGIDIDLFKITTAKISAAAAGTVTFAGGNPCCSYGLYVVIDHGNGFTTLYAHLSTLAVTAGQRVNQGDLIGYGGKTGYATGIHLHFEVHYNGNVIDPLLVLP